MLRKFLLLLLWFSLLIICGHRTAAQGCDTIGQNPNSSFPICGTDTFHQVSVLPCAGRTIPVPGCNDVASYASLNPYWYTFTCYKAGTLAFSITPEDQNDDYDWQLFDITGRNINDVFTNASLFVACNWSGNPGTTGASSMGSSLVNCAGFGYPTFSATPVLKLGHKYLMLISHFSGSDQSGYGLSFDGGTGSITDTLKPGMQSATTDCAGESVFLKLNKKMQCSSLTPNGSEFFIAGSGAKVISAAGDSCNSGFDIDDITLKLDRALPPGNYTLVIKKGTDNNTLLDPCKNVIADSNSIQFTVYPLLPTPMDSITPVLCEPNELSLVFRKRIRCSSIESSGSDFIVSGDPSINVIGAGGGVCSDGDGLSYIVKVKLNKPIQTAKNFSITLQKGRDGNTILDECAQETPAGSSLNFITADTVSAVFNYRLGLGCVHDTLHYAHDGRNSVNQWNWQFDVNGTSTVRDSFFLFDDYGAKHIRLSCSNGVCTDSSAVDVLLDNELISRFLVLPSTDICPNEAAFYIDSSTGKIVSWLWIFGDGNTSTLKTPPPKYYKTPLTYEGDFYPAALIVKNDIGCFDTSRTTLKAIYNCYIAVPSGFTPNGDGRNDYLYPLNAYKADNLEFKVYNRWGQLVFQTKNWTKKWDGRINGNPQPPGTYIWMLHYTNRDTKQFYSLKGTTVLIR